MKKVIVRIKGGLGNQLFCYAAARRLAIVNGAGLVIDDKTGFIRDYKYKRQYELDHFEIPVRRATSSERLEPFERYRRALWKWNAKRLPFEKRTYIEQEGRNFDFRLLNIKINGVVYIDGLWQSEKYFKDVENQIREDLKIIPPTDEKNLAMAKKINGLNAVALHVRWFDSPDSDGVHNVSLNYYRRAIEHIESKINNPSYFLFSDNPQAAKEKLDLQGKCVILCDHNKGDEFAFADLWLMTLCRHFIIANSTFSWWGAWLSENKDKQIVCPKPIIGKVTAWGFDGMIPEGWVEI